MPRSGGTYAAPASSWNPGVNAASATTVDWNALLADLVAALTQSWSVDGTSGATANWPLAGFKLTGLGAGSATGDSLRWEQLFAQGAETTIASAATCDIGAANTCFLNVTGTTGITSFGTNYNGPRYLRFSGAVLLTNSGTLVLPQGANYTTTAGDVAIVYPIAGPGWRVATILGSASIGAMLASAVAFTGGTISGTTQSGNTHTATEIYTGYTETEFSLGTGSAFSPAYANGSDQYATTNANATFTLPAPIAGKTIVLEITYGGAHTIAFAVTGGAAIIYPSGAPPIATSVNGKIDVYICKVKMDGTKWIIRDGGRNIG